MLSSMQQDPSVRMDMDFAHMHNYISHNQKRHRRIAYRKSTSSKDFQNIKLEYFVPIDARQD